MSLPLRAREAPVSAPAAIPCPNCGAALELKFCPACGERRPDPRDRSLVGLLHEAAATFSPVDGTIVRTLWALFTKPGLLTAEYFAGRRTRYTKPLAFFLAVNVAFFILQPHTGLLQYHLRDFMWVHSVEPFTPKPGNFGSMTGAVARPLARTHESYAAFEARFETELQEKKKSLLVFAIPLYALALQLLYVRRRRLFAEHLVFAVHTYAFYLVFLGFFLTALFEGTSWLLYGLHLYTRPVARALASETALTLALFVGMTLYVGAALRRVHGDGRARAYGNAAVLVLAQLAIIIVYRTILMWTTLWSVGAWSPLGT